MSGSAFIGAATGNESRHMSSKIIPGPDHERDFRNALGSFATGVTVITSVAEIGHVGITANSFASVSLDPALVLWSVAKGSVRHDSFACGAPFAIHVMARDQDHIATGFARDGLSFDNVDFEENPEGVRVIPDCLSVFECTTEALHDAGDHTIVVGRVQRFQTGSGEPLLFSQGKYGRFI